MNRLVILLLFLLLSGNGISFGDTISDPLFQPVDNSSQQSKILVKLSSDAQESADINTLTAGIQGDIITDYAELGFPGLYLIQVPRNKSPDESVQILSKPSWCCLCGT
jgi:hypothetical protein